jgi:chromate transporter
MIKELSVDFDIKECCQALRLDGLGLAETTPSPLIMVVQFVGFLGGWNHPGQLPPLLAATIGALVTTWTTFTPCFLRIFLGGPLH